MRVVRYTTDKAQEWDDFVKGSRNGTFLFLRGYMDYHSDRFTDHSLMYYSDKDKLLAVMAANEVVLNDMPDNKRKELHSHQGLTYGGFVLSPKVHAAEVGEMFDATLTCLGEEGFSEWHYKQISSVYHSAPSEDEEYWLWKLHAEIIDSSLMTVIPLQNNLLSVSSSKKNNSNRLLRQGYKVNVDAAIHTFWPILTQNLQERFNATPVHSYDEIMLLQSRFPENIKCFTVTSPDGEVLGGTILYLSDQVVKAQYTSASPQGKKLKVLDYLILEILSYYRQQSRLRYFDFGTSMLADSTDLNTGLVLQKEGFGGRGISCKIWKLTVNG